MSAVRFLRYSERDAQDGNCATFGPQCAKSVESHFKKHIACPGCLVVDKDKAVGRLGIQSPCRRRKQRA